MAKRLRWKKSDCKLCQVLSWMENEVIEENSKLQVVGMKHCWKLWNGVSPCFLALTSTGESGEVQTLPSPSKVNYPSNDQWKKSQFCPTTTSMMFGKSALWLKIGNDILEALCSGRTSRVARYVYWCCRGANKALHRWSMWCSTELSKQASRTYICDTVYWKKCFCKLVELFGGTTGGVRRIRQRCNCWNKTFRQYFEKTASRSLYGKVVVDGKVDLQLSSRVECDHLMNG